MEGATFNIIADTSALAMAQQTGESDVSLTIPSTSLSLFENNANYVVDGAIGSRGQVLYINFKNEFLKDINVRKAISMALIKIVMLIFNKGASEPANGLFPDSLAFGGKDLKGYSFDMEGAKKLLLMLVIRIPMAMVFWRRMANSFLTHFTYSTKAELPVFSEAMVGVAGSGY